jgi:hypothetical protein
VQTGGYKSWVMRFRRPDGTPAAHTCADIIPHLPHDLAADLAALAREIEPAAQLLAALPLNERLWCGNASFPSSEFHHNQGR